MGSRAAARRCRAGCARLAAPIDDRRRRSRADLLVRAVRCACRCIGRSGAETGRAGSCWVDLGRRTATSGGARASCRDRALPELLGASRAASRARSPIWRRRRRRSTAGWRAPSSAASWSPATTASRRRALFDPRVRFHGTLACHSPAPRASRSLPRRRRSKISPRTSTSAACARAGEEEGCRTVAFTRQAHWLLACGIAERPRAGAAARDPRQAPPCSTARAWASDPRAGAGEGIGGVCDPGIRAGAAGSSSDGCSLPSFANCGRRVESRPLPDKERRDRVAWRTTFRSWSSW